VLGVKGLNILVRGANFTAQRLVLEKSTRRQHRSVIMLKNSFGKLLLGIKPSKICTILISYLKYTSHNITNTKEIQTHKS